MDTSSFIQIVRKDVAVFKACLISQVEVTDSVLYAVWRAYLNIDIALPLKPFLNWTPGKDGALGERDILALSILEEMDAGLAKLEAFSNKSYMAMDKMSESPEALVVDNLWRELVACYAELANESIHEVPDEFKTEIIRGIIDSLTQEMGMNPEQVKNEFKVNEALRLSLRKSGIDPDCIKY